MQVMVLLVHPKLLVVEAAVDEGAGHRGVVRGIRVHVGHLALVTHGDAPGLVLKIVDIVVALDPVLSANLQIQQFIGVDSGVAKVEAGGHVLL